MKRSNHYRLSVQIKPFTSHSLNLSINAENGKFSLTLYENSEENAIAKARERKKDRGRP